MKNDLFFIKSKVTGGHWALKSEKSKKPFVNNMRECLSVDLYKDDIVVDIGAYVGEYSMWASQQGVKRVYSYEPTPNTFDVLYQNSLLCKNIFTENLAVVGNNDKYVELFISKGIGVTNSIAKSSRKSHSIKVPTIKYENAIQDATVVKIDVEGAEYGYNIIQPQLRAIILEFHPIVNFDWKTQAYNIMKDLEDSGFKPIMLPTFKSGWSLTGSWKR